MTTLAVCNHKGGTGKTTSVIHMAAALGLSGHRTLAIDLDPQGFLTRMLGVEEPPADASALALFQPGSETNTLPVTPVHGFDLLPSSSRFTKAMRGLNKPTDVFWAKEALESALDYAFVLIDTAAAITVFSLNALVAADYVLIPVTPEYQPVLGAEQTYHTTDMVRSKLNPELGESIFMFTQVDGRKSNHRAYRGYLRKKYGDKILRSIIRTNTVLSKRHEDGTTVFDDDPHSRGAHDYANAVDELLARMGHEDKRVVPYRVSRHWRPIENMGA